MGWMRIAGLADAVSIAQTQTVTDLVSLSSYANTQLAFAASNVSNDTYVTAVGFDLLGTSNSGRYFNGLRGVGNNTNAGTVEITEFTPTASTDSFYSLWNGRNGIVFAYNSPTSCDASINGSCTSGRGVVSASIMKDIDVKYDDGMPLTGSIVALKPHAARIGVTAGNAVSANYCTTEANATYGTSGGTAPNRSVDYISDSNYANDKVYGCNAVFQVESGAN